jgi:heme-degrading monooxygenase HmoA
MIRLHSLLPLSLAGLALAACGGDGDATEKPGCERGLLEADIEFAGPMAGPAVDPGTGELAAPPAAGYHVSTTYLRLRPDDAAQQRFNELVGPVTEQLATQAGLLGVQVSNADACGTARTMTLWQDEEAMFGFVFSDAHDAAVGGIDEISRGGSAFASWTATTLDDTTWDAAAAHLAEVDGPFY